MLSPLGKPGGVFLYGGRMGIFILLAVLPAVWLVFTAV